MSHITPDDIMMARRIARATAKRFSVHVRDRIRDDVFSDALLGLCVADRTYDPDRGVRFGAWAAIRIQHSIVDGLRRYGLTGAQGRLYPPNRVDHIACEDFTLEFDYAVVGPDIAHDLVVAQAADRVDRWLRLNGGPKLHALYRHLRSGGTQQEWAAMHGVTQAAASLQAKKMRRLIADSGIESPWAVAG